MEKMLDTEYRMWVEKWQRLVGEGQMLPSSVAESLVACDGNFYPNIRVILKLLCTLPVTTSECERTISHIRTLKNYLRSTMGQTRLNGLALMKIHRNISLNLEAAVDTFATLYNTQMVLLPKNLVKC